MPANQITQVKQTDSQTQVPKLIQEEVGNMNRSITSKETKIIAKFPPTQKNIPDQTALLVNSTK